MMLRQEAKSYDGFNIIEQDNSGAQAGSGVVTDSRAVTINNLSIGPVFMCNVVSASGQFSELDL